VFLNSPRRETPKNVIKKNREKVGFGLLVEIFVSRFLQNVFCSVFKPPSQKNTRKCDKTKDSRGKVDIESFVEILGKVFDTDFLPKYVCGVFELPLPRNAQKRTKKKNKGKKSRMVGGWV
jgi:hypothetical protein